MLAALYAPVPDRMYVAATGQGATLNGRPMFARDGDRLAGALAAGPKPLVDRVSSLGVSFELEPKVHSLALRFARVGDGTLDVAFASTNSHDWDLAAADLLVHEAGGVLTTLAGRALIYNRPDPVHGVLVAAGAKRHAALMDLVRDRAAEFA